MESKRKLIQWAHISPECLIQMLIHNLWMILATAAIFALAASLVLTWFHTPEYQASMTYAVNSRTTSYLSSGNLTSTREVASVLSELLETDLITEGIRESDPRLANFNSTITATQVGESNFIDVTITADTPETAFLALDALVEVFPTVADFISSRNVLNITRNPTVSPYPSNMVNTTRICQIAAIAGALLMAALLCYLSIQAETVQTRTGARNLLDAPIIAALCHEKKNRTLKATMSRTHKQVQVFSPATSFDYTEQVSAICNQLEHEATTRGRKIFLITGVSESEGKSTVAGNIASAMALKGHQVALVDCDLRSPAQHTFFNGQYDSPLPLNELLAKPFSKDNLLQCMVPYENTGLHMLFPLKPDRRSTELLSSNTMATLLQELRTFDYVIVDSPPMGMFPDAEVLADLVDATMLVVRQDHTAACDINDGIDTLRQYKAAFIGCILNDMHGYARKQYGYGGKYGYGQKYGYGHKYGYGSHGNHGNYSGKYATEKHSSSDSHTGSKRS
jgi:capsular exopolysaccharide synthesis family protein